MKKIIYKIVLALSIVAVSSCDEGFDELNTSQTGAVSLDPALVLNNAIINSSPNSAQLNYELPIVQQITTPNTGVLEGGNFNKNNPNSSINNWQGYYRNVIRYTNDVITRTVDDPNSSNIMNKARIIQANAFMIITDTYGSIPFEEGGKGFTEQIFFPVYQDQQTIYQSLVQELKSATDALDAGQPEVNDVLYAGDIAKWKKFGYSLLLRAGMRLSEVDASLAETTVAAAFAGGVITDNADNAVILHDGNFPSNLGNILTGTEAANFYLAEPFVSALKSNDDPRLPAIAVRYVGANSGPGQVPAVATTDSDDQFGMPMGSTDGAADISGATLPGGGTRYAYSQLDRTRLARPTASMTILTAGQNHLLLAEARSRGYINTGTVEEYFAEGIRQHMNQLGIIDAGSTVDAADREAYIASRVALLAGNELEEIGYEYWIASFMNGQEAWANFRRTGYPVLPVNPFPGRDVDWITRLPYPPNELLVNAENVQAAITAQGPDELDTQVWWDVD